MTPRPTWIAVALTSLLGLACSSGSSTVHQGALELCGAASTAQLDKLAACQGASAAAAATWKTAAAAWCQALAGEVAAGRATYDPAQGTTCSTALPSLTCDAAATAGSLPGAALTLPACAGAVAGAVAAAATCFDDLDCAADDYCTASATASCPGTCAPRAALSTSCLDKPCAAGLACDFASGGVCRTASAPGGPCPCRADAYCDGTGASPLCQALKVASTPCSGSFECAPGLLCAGAPSLCQPPAAPAATCVPTAPGCAPGYVCDPNAKTCQPEPIAGDLCVVTVPPSTTFTLLCLDGWCDTAGTLHCQPFKAEGASCGSDLECRGHCDPVSSTCTASAGLACTAP
jgi:hypothetical protein